MSRFSVPAGPDRPWALALGLPLAPLWILPGLVFGAIALVAWLIERWVVAPRREDWRDSAIAVHRLREVRANPTRLSPFPRFWTEERGRVTAAFGLTERGRVVLMLPTTDQIRAFAAAGVTRGASCGRS